MRKGQTVSTALMISGIVIAAVVMIGVLEFLGVSGAFVIKRLQGESLNRFEYATPESFQRLNEEIEILLEEDGYTYKYIPYTLGPKSKLVGFMEGEEKCQEEYSKPPECRRAACLCICDKKGCNDCEIYPEVDYFVVPKKFGGNNIPLIAQLYVKPETKKMEKKDPVTGEDIHCLQISGKQTALVVDPTGGGATTQTRDWNTRNIFVEKSENNGETYILIARKTDYTENRIKNSCPPPKVSCNGECREKEDFACFPPDSEFTNDQGHKRWCNEECQVSLIGCDQFDSYPIPPEDGCNCGGKPLQYGEGYCVDDEIKPICNMGNKCSEQAPTCCVYEEYTECTQHPNYCDGEINPEASYQCTGEEISDCCACGDYFECYGYCCEDGWQSEPCSSDEICRLEGDYYDKGETICGSAARLASVGCGHNIACGCSAYGTWTLDRTDCGDEGKECVDGECV